MRNMLIFVIAAAASACASGAAPDGVGDQFAGISASCRDRGGVLTPSIDRPLSGKGGSGYVCRINGSGSRIQPQSTAS